MLSNISLNTRYIRIGEIDNILAGMPPFNLSSITAENASISLPGNFMFNTNLLYNPKSTISISPLSKDCQAFGIDCYSYFLPGPLDRVNTGNGDGRVLSIPPVDRRNATHYVVETAPGYQLEFSPFRETILFTELECRIIGVWPSVHLIDVCLKNVGDDLMAGTKFIMGELI